MTTRIEHAAEAVNFLGAVTYDTHGDDDRKVQLAQVHATLALVEQQRIANLIALHKHEVKYDIGSWSRIYEEDDVPTPTLKADIREGLGL